VLNINTFIFPLQKKQKTREVGLMPFTYWDYNMLAE